MSGRELPLPLQRERAAAKAASSAGAFYVKKPLADVRASADQGAELVTQVLWGDKVKVLQQVGDWLYGQVPDGYLGWLQKKDIVLEKPPAGKDLAAVIVARARLYQGPDAGRAIVGELLMGTDLPLIQVLEEWVEVWLPGQGRAWLPRLEVEIWPGGKLEGERSGRDVLRTAERLQGVAYLWGGISCYGIDCSGLAYIAYYLNGVNLPRDADQQYAVGEPVAAADLQAGDLVFFNTEGTGELPTHVGIYNANGYFLNSRSPLGVVVSSLEEPHFVGTYLGARRYLGL